MQESNKHDAIIQSTTPSNPFKFLKALSVIHEHVYVNFDESLIRFFSVCLAENGGQGEVRKTLGSELSKKCIFCLPLTADI